jgi:dihydrofolate reductase
MTRLRVRTAISLDGYTAGPSQSVEDPLGKGGMALHEWVFPLAVFHAMQGGDGGIVNESSAVVAEAIENIGAVIMGRNMFGGSGAWGDDPWNGWWGDDPPFHAPVFVLTHHAREPLVLGGGTTFFFVTDGIESAFAQARQAAGDKDISLAGGANAIQQFIRAGLVDELLLHLVPVVLGGGERLLEDLGPAASRWEIVRTVQAPGVTHLTYQPLR